MTPNLWLLTLVTLLTSTVSGLQEGAAPRGLVDLFCKGINGLAPVPWDCSGYLVCQSAPQLTEGSWYKCKEGMQFDPAPEVLSCVYTQTNCEDRRNIAAMLCPKLPNLKFPHPGSCALYYDCSQTQTISQYQMDIYENECRYPHKFDERLGECRTDTQDPPGCRPMTKADYRREALDTFPGCEMMPDGLHPNPILPPYSPEYTECRGGMLTGHHRCFLGRVFDPVASTCVIDFTESLKIYCASNPLAVFPDRQHCARYYNCSQTRSPFRHNRYLTECDYMDLYDTARQQCAPFDQLITPCGTRFEPKNPCEYKVGQCPRDRDFCIPCAAKCRGLRDGPHPFPGLPNTRFHMICRAGRTQDILKCNQGDIYDTNLRRCVPEDPPPPPPPLKPVPTAGCQCMDKIDPLDDAMKELRALVEKLGQPPPAVPEKSPYDCDEPPTIENTIVKLQYTDAAAQAVYTCVEGYTHCPQDMTGTCPNSNNWNMDSIGKCFQNVWTDTQEVDLPCKLSPGSAIEFTGRAITDSFDVILHQRVASRTDLYLTVKPSSQQVIVGTDTLDDVLLSNELRWLILVEETALKIFLNEDYLTSVAVEPYGDETMTFTIVDKFLLSVIRFHPRGFSDLSWRRLESNLALGKHASSSSSVDTADPGAVVDGLSQMQLMSPSCWMSKDTDTDPWWSVDLGKPFHVSAVVITTPTCDGPCELDMSVFDIVVYAEKGLSATTCFSSGTMLLGEMKTFTCDDHVIGRKVLVQRTRSVTKSMALCEVEVYGGYKKEKAWTPFSCLEPPLIKGATLELSYTDFEAIATYTCDDQSMFCSKNKDVIRCKNETGWDGTPGECTDTVVKAKDGDNVNEFIFCPLDLGSGLEFWVTPKTEGGKIQITKGSSILYELYFKSEAFKFGKTEKLSGEHPFVFGKETHVVIKLLSGSIQIEADDFQFEDTDIADDLYMATNIYATGPVRMREVRYHPAIAPDLITEKLAADLAEVKDTEVSSDPGTVKAGLTDETLQCWVADKDDKTQWAQINLDKHYFITSVKISLPEVIRRKRSVDITNPPGLRDVSVYVYTVNPSKISTATATLCHKVTNEMTQDSSIYELSCDSDVWGRYVRVVADTVRDEVDPLHICLVRVFGDLVTQDSSQDGWSPNDCPSPPTHPNAEVTVAVTPDYAVAHYTCLDGYSICDGNNRITCDSKEGWKGAPGPCIKRSIDVSISDDMLPEFCMMKLGQTIEVILTPLPDRSVLTLKNNDDKMELHFGAVDNELLIKTTVLDIETLGEVQEVKISNIPIEYNKKMKIKITFLSPAYHIDIDGKTFYRKFNARWDEVFVTMGRVTKYAFIDNAKEILLVPLSQSLTENGIATSSSSWDDPTVGITPDMAMDGYQQSCWLPLETDTDPWWMVHLSQYHFITHVEIWTSLTKEQGSTCPSDCETSDFRIDVFYEPPKDLEPVDVCVEHSGILTPQSKTVIPCDKTVIGSYLRLVALNQADKNALFALCDIKVFGSIVIKAGAQDTVKEASCSDSVATPQQRKKRDIYHSGGVDHGSTAQVDDESDVGSPVLSRHRRGVIMTEEPVAKPTPCVDRSKEQNEPPGNGQRNLALYRPVTVSSEDGTGGNTVDGILTDTCWTPSLGDVTATWTVDLDDLYYVKHVDIIRGCVGCNPGIEFDIEILSMYENPSTAVVCSHYKGLFPTESRKLFKCTNSVPAKVVHIQIITFSEFELCEVRIFGEQTFIGVKNTDKNIALNRAVTASSGGALTQNIVDGNKIGLVSDNTCWSAEAGETNSWVMVDLGDFYIITGAEISYPTDCASPCESILGEYEIHVLMQKKSGEAGATCLTDSNAITSVASDMLECYVEHLGRYVQLMSHNRDPSNPLNFCEFAIYGKKVSNAEWQPSDCPEPPLLTNGKVCICYESDLAVATYTCNTNYSMCTGSQELYCNSKAGWEGTPGLCVETTRGVHHGHMSDIGELSMCFPQLGAGLELWVTPKESLSYIEILSHRGESIKLEMIPELEPASSQTPGTLKMKIPLDRESHIELVYLTEGLLVRVNNEKVALMSYIDTFPRFYYVKSSKNLQIRMGGPLEGDPKDIIRVEADKAIQVRDQVTELNCRFDVLGPEKSIILTLDGYYFIRQLILHNSQSSEFVTKGFEVHVMPMKSMDDIAMLCASYKGPIQSGAVETIQCREEVWGKYIQITSSFADDLSDNLALCKIEILGDKVVEKDKECPPPDTIQYGTVQVSQARGGKTVATYTCDDGYAMCLAGTNTLECSDGTNWVGTVGECLEVSKNMDYGTQGILDHPTCFMKLGEGLQFAITPTTEGGSFSLSFSDLNALDVVYAPGINGGQPGVDLQRGATINTVDKKLFTFGRESIVSVIFLSKQITILVDDVFLAASDIEEEKSVKTIIGSTSGVFVRSLEPISRYKPGIIRKQIAEDLALGKSATVSSIDTEKSFINNTNDLFNGWNEDFACWGPTVDDKEQWIRVDLVNYYFIRAVVITFTDQQPLCASCAGKSHDINVDVLQNSKVDELKMNCGKYIGYVPKQDYTWIHCADNVWGRFINIEAIEKDAEVMTICNIEVYGDEVIDREYEVCPESLPSVDLTYSSRSKGDIGAYDCKDGFYACRADRSITCLESAWDTAVIECDQHRWVNLSIGSPIDLPCGSPTDVEILVRGTPYEETYFVVSIADNDFFMHFQMAVNFVNLAYMNQVVFNSNSAVGVSTPFMEDDMGTEQVEADFPFTLNKEVEIKIRAKYLGQTFHVLVDGVEKYSYTSELGIKTMMAAHIEGEINLALVDIQYFYK